MRAFTLANYRANKFHRIAKTTINSMARIVRCRSSSFQDLILESDAFGVIFLEPSVCSFFVRKTFEMAGVANTVSGVDIDPNGCHRSLASLRHPNASGVA